MSEEIWQSSISPEEHCITSAVTRTAHCADCDLDVIVGTEESRRIEVHDFVDGVCICGLYEQPEA